MSDMQDENADVDPGPGAGLPGRERDYVIPAQDAHGRSVRLYCRAMPTSGRLLADVVASRKYPFRTIGDCIRWCISTGVKRLASGAGIESVMAQSDAILETLRDEEFQLQFKELFTIAKNVVESYIEAGAHEEARRVIANLRAKLDKMPEGYWKTRHTEYLLKQWGSLLTVEGGGVSFADDHASE